jgi:hypothetical protein
MKRYKLYFYLLIAFMAGYIANMYTVKRLFIDSGLLIKGIMINDTQLIIESLDHVIRFFQ